MIFFARYEASQFGSMTIETEHLLLGLIREDKSLTNRFLRNASPIESLRHEIEGRIPIREKVAASIDLPLSDECKRILAYAAEEAERLNHRHIGTEHLLLGMLREENCVGAQVLGQRGLQLNAIREELAGAAMPEDSPGADRSYNPVLPKSGVVPDADTALRIAEAIWIPLYDVDTIESQRPLKAELKHGNVWIVTGSTAPGEPEGALFAFILQADGRILSVGRGKTNE